MNRSWAGEKISPAVQKQQFVAMDAMMPLIRERLSAGQSVKLSPRGISMLPMLREGVDSVTLSLPPKRLRKYVIPLYRRADGQYILHRVVAVKDGYVCMGDNQFVKEYGVSHESVIAVVTALHTREGNTA